MTLRSGKSIRPPTPQRDDEAATAGHELTEHDGTPPGQYDAVQPQGTAASPSGSRYSTPVDTDIGLNDTIVHRPTVGDNVTVGTLPDQQPTDDGSLADGLVARGNFGSLSAPASSRRQSPGSPSRVVRSLPPTPGSSIAGASLTYTNGTARVRANGQPPTPQRASGTATVHIDPPYQVLESSAASQSEMNMHATGSISDTRDGVLGKAEQTVTGYLLRRDVRRMNGGANVDTLPTARMNPVSTTGFDSLLSESELVPQPSAYATAEAPSVYHDATHPGIRPIVLDGSSSPASAGTATRMRNGDDPHCVNAAEPQTATVQAEAKDFCNPAPASELRSAGEAASTSATTSLEHMVRALSQQVEGLTKIVTDVVVSRSASRKSRSTSRSSSRSSASERSSRSSSRSSARSSSSRQPSRLSATTPEASASANAPSQRGFQPVIRPPQPSTPTNADYVSLDTQRLSTKSQQGDVLLGVAPATGLTAHELQPTRSSAQPGATTQLLQPVAHNPTSASAVSPQQETTLRARLLNSSSQPPDRAGLAPGNERTATPPGRLNDFAAALRPLRYDPSRRSAVGVTTTRQSVAHPSAASVASPDGLPSETQLNALISTSTLLTYDQAPSTSGATATAIDKHLDELVKRIQTSKNNDTSYTRKLVLKLDGIIRNAIRLRQPSYLQYINVADIESFAHGSAQPEVLAATVIHVQRVAISHLLRGLGRHATFIVQSFCDERYPGMHYTYLHAIHAALEFGHGTKQSMLMTLYTDHVHHPKPAKLKALMRDIQSFPRDEATAHEQTQFVLAHYSQKVESRVEFATEFAFHRSISETHPDRPAVTAVQQDVTSYLPTTLSAYAMVLARVTKYTQLRNGTTNANAKSKHKAATTSSEGNKTEAPPDDGELPPEGVESTFIMQSSYQQHSGARGRGGGRGGRSRGGYGKAGGDRGNGRVTPSFDGR